MKTLEPYLTYLIPLALLLFLFLQKKLRTSNKNVKNLTGAEAESLLGEHKDILILDVRTKGEFSSGHIPEAKNIPVQELTNRISEIAAHTTKPVFVYCASGGRSPGALSILLRNNFTEIYHLSRGISSWPGKIKR